MAARECIYMLISRNGSPFKVRPISRYRLLCLRWLRYSRVFSISRDYAPGPTRVLLFSYIGVRSRSFFSASTLRALPSKRYSPPWFPCARSIHLVLRDFRNAGATAAMFANGGLRETLRCNAVIKRLTSTKRVNQPRTGQARRRWFFERTVQR